MKLGKNAKDLTGDRFFRLVAIKPISKDKKKNIVWLFRCDCGREKKVTGWCVSSGKTKSCGCYNREQLTKSRTKHGFRHTRFYKIYIGINTRCKNKKNHTYTNYGGRGIENEWKS